MQVALAAEQTPDQRQVAKTRQTVAAGALFVADQTGKNLRLAVAQAQDGVGVARTDLVGQRIRRPGHLLGHAADFEADLDRHVVFKIDLRLDFKPEADVEIADRRRDADVGGRCGGEHRQFVADMDLGFFAVAHTNSGIGQQVAVTQLAAQIQYQGRIRHVGGEAGGVARVDVAGRQRAAERRRLAERVAGRTEHAVDHIRRDPAVADLVGEAHAQLFQAAAVDLQHFEFEHHFRFGDIDTGHQFFGQLDGLRRIADNHQIEFFIDMHVAYFQHRFQHHLHLLGFGVGQEEGAQRQLLIILGLGRRVRVDEESVVVELPLLQLIGCQDQADHFFERGIAHEDGDFGIAFDVAVEDEVDAGTTRQHLENGFQRRIAKLQRHRLAEGAAAFRRALQRRRLALFNAGQQALRLAITRLLRQHRAQQRLGERLIVLLKRRRGIAQQPAVALVDADLGQPLRCTRVPGFDPECAPETLLGFVETTFAARLFTSDAELVGRQQPLAGKRRADFPVIRRLFRRLFEQGQTALVAPFVQRLLALLAG